MYISLYIKQQTKMNTFPQGLASLPQGLASLPNELIIIIFNFIKKITDKRQFLKTCKLHNTLLKGLITEMSESELDYFKIDFNDVEYDNKKFYYDDYLKERDYCVERFMMELCYDSYFDMIPLSYLTKNINNTVIVKLLIKYGKLELLLYAIDDMAAKFFPICELAAESGQLNILKWAIEKEFYSDYNWDSKICTIAARHGHLETLKWARENYYDWSPITCLNAALNGHLHILKWAVENGCKWDSRVCRFAARNGHLDVLKWARENGCKWDSMVCPSAAKNGHLDVLKWARENGCPE